MNARRTGIGLALLVGDRARLLGDRADAVDLEGAVATLERAHGVGGDGGRVRVALVGLAGATREKDQALLVGGQALDVELERLLGPVPAAVVDGDADRARLLGRDLGLLELVKGEAAAGAQAHVVPDRRRADGGAEELGRADAGAGRLALAGHPSRLLAPGLVEPGLDPTLPVLSAAGVSRALAKQT